MGVNSRLRDIRPPLPAPTESMDEGGTSGLDTDVATNVTTRTDKTSYEVPEDGSPITISTQKITARKDAGPTAHQRDKSQTSLLIEYFEGTKGDRTKSRPSVRVKVTPSARKKSGGGGVDAVQVTSIGKDRKASYTRRISLGSSKNAEVGRGEGTEISQSTGSNVSSRPPVEIEVLDQNGSDLSHRSRGLMYANYESNVSSMPADSMLEGTNLTQNEQSRGFDRDDDVTVKDYLSAPTREKSSRSRSRDRIAQKVMEKLGQPTTKPRKPSKSSSERSLSYDQDGYPVERRRRSSKSHQYDEDTVTGAESSLLSSNAAPSQRSYRSASDISKRSEMTNNPKLLGMVEDTIKRIILPEINAIKEDQKNDRNLRSFESSRRGSLLEDMYERKGLGRSLSKSSSSPNIAGKPKVVLNREGDDPGTVLSRGDSERKSTRKFSRGSYTEERPSSRRSSGRQSSTDHYDNSEMVRPKSSKSSHKLRDTAAAGMVGGVLTTAALNHHDSQDDVYQRRKKRSKSRGSHSRSASATETGETYTREEAIPPMPMASRINDSEMTRDSIVSVDTETPQSQASAGMRTPIREVSRGSLGGAMSPASSRTPTRTPVSRNLGMSHTNLPFGSPKSPNGGFSTKERMAELAAAGVGGAAVATDAEDLDDNHVDADGYGDLRSTQRDISSPVQSVSSLKKNFEDDQLVPQELRPRSAASRSSAGRLRDKNTSRTSLHSKASSPSTKLARSRKHSQNISGDEFVTPMEQPGANYMRESSGTPGTPMHGESIDDWYEHQHRLNDQYRDSLDLESPNRDSFAAGTNRDSYQTNPYPQDENRFTTFSEDSQDDPALEQAASEQDVRSLGANPGFIHTPHGAESAVASLIMEPSTVSSNKLSSRGSPTKSSYSDRMAAHLRDMSDDSPAIYEGSTLSQTMPSQDRWAQLKGRAHTMSGSPINGVSPRQSPAKVLAEERPFGREREMSASALPVSDDPMPEIGHIDDSKSDLSTNPSVIQGPLGGDASGKDTWPYTPEPAERELSARDSRSLRSGPSHEGGLVAAAAAGSAALAAAHAAKQPYVEDERDAARSLTPDVSRNREYIDREATPTSPAAFRDEGYVTDGHARSTGALTPRASQQYSKEDVDDFNRAMDAQSLGEEDPFTTDLKHARHTSGNSHGMASPLYDSSTGKGIDNIESKDIVALMDHLTVRDAQRNARDTEILVTLVRSAAEMRQSFDEMRRFIVEQDRIIMQNADRGADQTVQKVLGGPRPLPASLSPRTPKRQSEEDIQTKRKGVLRRALKGLTGSKSSNDLAKVEDMLIKILDNVEDLKHQGVQRPPGGSYTNDSLDTYERLRNMPDSGYEPEGQAGTSSTPSHSGQLELTPRGEKHQFHSGYDGRRGSENRVSTVLEADEDELEPHERHVLNNQFENNERFHTPTQETSRQLGVSPTNTPPRTAAGLSGAQDDDLTPRSTDKQRKHKSNSSSIFGVPKVSRWSKTTASSAAPDPAALDSPNVARNQQPQSQASRSGSSLGKYDGNRYEPRDDDSLRSSESFAREPQPAETRSIRSQASKITRTPSPLIPSEASYHRQDEYEDERQASPVQEDTEADFDDPKYHAHRNSLLLEHPQPRQGTTGRHQSTLETQAHEFDDPLGTNSDVSQRTVSDFDPAMWGSSGTAGLAKHRLSQLEPISPVSMDSPRGYVGSRAAKDEGPLVPQQKPAVPPKIRHEEPEPEPEWEPQYSASGFSRAGYYNSPFGSGHLLEPIEEVRYSLETDSGHVSEAAFRSYEELANVETDLARAAGRNLSGHALASTQDNGSKAHGRSGADRQPAEDS